MIESKQVSELLARIQRGRTAIREERAAGRERADWQVHLTGLERALLAELQPVAYRQADRISDMLGIGDPLVRAINRVSWLICDCEDAGLPDDAIAPLRAEKRRLGAEFERRAETEAA